MSQPFNTPRIVVAKPKPKRSSTLEEKMLWQIRAAKLPRPETEFKFLPDRKFRFDFAWPDLMWALEVEGGSWQMGRHQRPAGFENDCRKYSLAAIAGWRVVRVTAGMVASGEALRLIESALASESEGVKALEGYRAKIEGLITRARMAEAEVERMLKLTKENHAPSPEGLAIETCDSGHRHARLAEYQGCPVCLRQGITALQAHEGEIERRGKITEQEQKEEAFRDAASRLIAITEGTDIYEYREEADIWICRWCCERQPEHAAQCAWLIFVQSFAALQPNQHPAHRCPRCGDLLLAGQALMNSANSGLPDFPDSQPEDRGQTFSFTGEAKLVDVLKCPSCGYSRTAGKERHPASDLRESFEEWFGNLDQVQRDLLTANGDSIAKLNLAIAFTAGRSSREKEHHREQQAHEDDLHGYLNIAGAPRETQIKQSDLDNRLSVAARIETLGQWFEASQKRNTEQTAASIRRLCDLIEQGAEGVPAAVLPPLSTVEEMAEWVFKARRGREEAQAECSALRAVLSAIEWIKDQPGTFWTYCPACGHAKPDGDPTGRHEPGCRLAAALKREEKPDGD